MPALRTIRVRTRLSNPQEPPPGMTPLTYGDGLALDGTTLEADFGTGHTEVARGDSTGGADLSTATPQPLGSATAGASGEASDAAHVHAMPSAADVGAVPTSRTVTPLTGLTGGGALSDNISLAVDTTVIATRTYVDTGDADTLAAAQAYTDAHSAPYLRAALNVMGNAILGTTVGAAPHWCDGASLVLMIWPLSVPGNTKLLLDRGTNDCMIRVGDNGGDRGRLSTYENGTLALLPADHTITGNLNGCHVLALSCTGGNVRSSWDGGTVGVTSVGGAPAAPGSSIFAIGGSVNGSGTYVADIEYVAARTYSTVLSDADLQAAGSPAGRAAGAIPALTGTVSWEFTAKDLRGGLIAEILHSAVILDYGAGVLKRNRSR